MALKDKLREQRGRLGLSLDTLATKTGSSKSYLWALENHSEKKPSAKKLSKIADALNVTTHYLIDDNATMDDGQRKEAFFRKFNRLDDDDKSASRT